MKNRDMKKKMKSMHKRYNIPMSLASTGQKKMRTDVKLAKKKLNTEHAQNKFKLRQFLSWLHKNCDKKTILLHILRKRPNKTTSRVKNQQKRLFFRPFDTRKSYSVPFYIGKLATFRKTDENLFEK